MIIKTIKTIKDLKDERHLAFAINEEGIAMAGSAAQALTDKIWPELLEGKKTKLGTIVERQVNGYHFYGICCYSAIHGWYSNQEELVKQCFDSIDLPNDEPIVALSIGTEVLDVLQGADVEQIYAGLRASKKHIIVYNPNLKTE